MFVDCCSCLLFVVCWLMRDARMLLRCLFCYLLFVVCWLWFNDCCVLFVVPCVLLVFRCLLCVACDELFAV